MSNVCFQCRFRSLDTSRDYLGMAFVEVCVSLFICLLLIYVNEIAALGFKNHLKPLCLSHETNIVSC